MTQGEQAIIPRPVVGALAGLVAGLIASYVMNEAQKLLPVPDTGADEPATVKAADRVAFAATGDTVASADRELAGEITHYALGAALGVAYGLAAEYRPAITRGVGVPFGLAAAAVLDEAIVPAARITDPPWAYSFGVHVYSAVSHAIFGASTELVRGLLLAAAPRARAVANG